MLRNYFIVSWRNIKRHKGYALINVLGLGLGLCACIVIYLIAHFELSFDTFHPGRQRIYRVMTNISENNGNRLQWGTVPMPGVQLLGSGLTGVDAIAAVKPLGISVTIPEIDKPRTFDARSDGNGYPVVAMAQPTWFSIFSYKWLAGNVSSDPMTVVLTEHRAHQYFGQGPADGMIGRIILYDSIPMRVSGVVKDWDKNTDLPFTDLISFSTLQTTYFKNNSNAGSWRPDGELLLTFVRLSKDHRPEKVQAQMASVIKGHPDADLKLSLELDPLSDLHFRANVIECPIRTAHMPTLYALMGIALFILLIAAINFINLSTAQSLQRAKEVGVRKVLGSSRTSLVFQFLTETLVLSLIAVLLAILLVYPVLTAFRSFLPPGLSFRISDPPVLFFLVGITLVTTLLAGLYPAKVLSGYLPVLTLKGSDGAKGGRSWYLRKGLIVFQFTVSLVFIIGSIVIGGQMSYARHKDLGFTSDAIITIGTPGGDSLSKVRVVAERMRQFSGVGSVALQWAGPGNPKQMGIKYNGTGGKEIHTAQVDGDENMIPLYQLKLVAGRNLSHADSVNEFVINETLARTMGCKRPEEAIGRTVVWLNKPYPVVGVAADFHPGSLHNAIPPLCIINRVERERTLVVKLATKGKESGTIKPLLARLEQTWKEVYPAGTFSYEFYDDLLAKAYQNDQKTGTLMNTAMGITIFISCIGLFGLAMFTAEKRTREIGIRKVMGASVTDITLMLTKDFVVLIMISALIASPIAWYFMDDWLKGFAYRINMSWWTFLLGALSALVVGLVTVSCQAMRAALQNPVKSLRTE